MAERPILFSAPMVRAILDGQKTQTRRVVKPQPPEYVRHSVAPQALRGEPQKHPAPYFDAYNGGPHWCWWDEYDRQGDGWIKCPYGKPGDRLWVREAFTIVPASAYRMSEGVQQVVNPHDTHEAAIFAAGWDRSIPKWKPSIHMPRWASRILLEIISIRVERLNDCSNADARAEGVWQGPSGAWFTGPHGLIAYPDPVAAYAALWLEINGDASWEANPFVWVVEFKRVQA